MLKKCGTSKIFLGHNRVEKWTSRHETTMILHEFSVRIFLVRPPNPTSRVFGRYIRKWLINHARNQCNMPHQWNMESERLENGRFENGNCVEMNVNIMIRPSGPVLNPNTPLKSPEITKIRNAGKSGKSKSVH